MDDNTKNLIIAAFGATPRALTDDEGKTLKAFNWTGKQMEVLDADDINDTSHAPPISAVLVDLSGRSPEDRGVNLAKLLAAGKLTDGHAANVKAVFEVKDPPKPVEKPPEATKPDAPGVTGKPPAEADPSLVSGKPGTGEEEDEPDADPPDPDAGKGKEKDKEGGEDKKKEKPLSEGRKLELGLKTAEAKAEEARANVEAANAKKALVTAEEEAAAKRHHREEDGVNLKRRETRRKEVEQRLLGLDKDGKPLTARKLTDAEKRLRDARIDQQVAEAEERAAAAKRRQQEAEEAAANKKNAPQKREMFWGDKLLIALAAMVVVAMIILGFIVNAMLGGSFPWGWILLTGAIIGVAAFVWRYRALIDARIKAKLAPPAPPPTP